MSLRCSAARFRLASVPAKLRFAPKSKCCASTTHGQDSLSPSSIAPWLTGWRSIKPVAQAAYITGWRTKSELLTRQWRHVDLVNGWLRLEPGEGKTKQPREFPCTPDLRALLETQRERVREIERATGRFAVGVCHSDGSRIKDFRYAWAKACRLAGVPGDLFTTSDEQPCAI